MGLFDFFKSGVNKKQAVDLEKTLNAIRNENARRSRSYEKAEPHLTADDKTAYYALATGVINMIGDNLYGKTKKGEPYLNIYNIANIIQEECKPDASSITSPKEMKLYIDYLDVQIKYLHDERPLRKAGQKTETNATEDQAWNANKLAKTKKVIADKPVVVVNEKFEAAMAVQANKDKFSNKSSDLKEKKQNALREINDEISEQSKAAAAARIAEEARIISSKVTPIKYILENQSAFDKSILSTKSVEQVNLKADGQNFTSIELKLKFIESEKLIELEKSLESNIGLLFKIKVESDSISILPNNKNLDAVATAHSLLKILGIDINNPELKINNRDPYEKTNTVAVIGAGMAGMNAATQLARYCEKPVKIKIIKRSEDKWGGIAYGMADTNDKTNVPITLMSMDVENTGKMLDWSKVTNRTNWQDINDNLTPLNWNEKHQNLNYDEYSIPFRQNVGQYLYWQLEYQKLFSNKVNIEVVNGEAVAFGNYKDLAFVKLASGENIYYDAAILATGFTQSKTVDEIQKELNAINKTPSKKTYINDIYADGARQQMKEMMPENGSVFVVGTNLSGMETARKLLEDGKAEKIYMFSRHNAKFPKPRETPDFSKLKLVHNIEKYESDDKDYTESLTKILLSAYITSGLKFDDAKNALVKRIQESDWEKGLSNRVMWYLPYNNKNKEYFLEYIKDNANKYKYLENYSLMVDGIAIKDLSDTRLIDLLDRDNKNGLKLYLNNKQLVEECGKAGLGFIETQNYITNTFPYFNKQEIIKTIKENPGFFRPVSDKATYELLQSAVAEGKIVLLSGELEKISPVGLGDFTIKISSQALPINANMLITAVGYQKDLAKDNSPILKGLSNKKNIIEIDTNGKIVSEKLFGDVYYTGHMAGSENGYSPTTFSAAAISYKNSTAIVGVIQNLKLKQNAPIRKNGHNYEWGLSSEVNSTIINQLVAETANKINYNFAENINNIGLCANFMQEILATKLKNVSVTESIDNANKAEFFVSKTINDISNLSTTLDSFNSSMKRFGAATLLTHIKDNILPEIENNIKIISTNLDEKTLLADMAKIPQDFSILNYKDTGKGFKEFNEGAYTGHFNRFYEQQKRENPNFKISDNMLENFVKGNQSAEQKVSLIKEALSLFGDIKKADDLNTDFIKGFIEQKITEHIDNIKDNYFSAVGKFAENIKTALNGKSADFQPDEKNLLDEINIKLDSLKSLALARNGAVSNARSEGVDFGTEERKRA